MVLRVTRTCRHRWPVVASSLPAAAACTTLVRRAPASLHMQLKPQNVLLKTEARDRRGYVAKLCDFGLSRIMGAEQTSVETGKLGTCKQSGFMMWSVAAGTQQGGWGACAPLS